MVLGGSMVRPSLLLLSCLALLCSLAEALFDSGLFRSLTRPQNNTKKAPPGVETPTKEFAVFHRLPNFQPYLIAIAVGVVLSLLQLLWEQRKGSGPITRLKQKTLSPTSSSSSSPSPSPPSSSPASTKKNPSASFAAAKSKSEDSKSKNSSEEDKRRSESADDNDENNENSEGRSKSKSTGSSNSARAASKPPAVDGDEGRTPSHNDSSDGKDDCRSQEAAENAAASTSALAAAANTRKAAAPAAANTNTKINAKTNAKNAAAAGERTASKSSFAMSGALISSSSSTCCVPTEDKSEGTSMSLKVSQSTDPDESGQEYEEDHEQEDDLDLEGSVQEEDEEEEASGDEDEEQPQNVEEAEQPQHQQQQQQQQQQQPQQQQRPPLFGRTLSALEKASRSIKGLLNKLTRDNYDRIYQQLVEEARTPDSPDDRAAIVAVIAKDVFAKATTQHGFVDLYADLCCQLHQDLESCQDGSEIRFKRVVVSNCQQSLSYYLVENPTEKELSEEEKYEEHVKFRTAMLGNALLVGHLLKRSMLSPTVVFLCAERLLLERSAGTLETLCVLLGTLGRNFDNPSWKGYSQLDDIFFQLEGFADDASQTQRTRCLIKDLLDLRKSKWKQPSPGGEASTQTASRQQQQQQQQPHNQQQQQHQQRQHHKQYQHQHQPGLPPHLPQYHYQHQHHHHHQPQHSQPSTQQQIQLLSQQQHHHPEASLETSPHGSCRSFADTWHGSAGDHRQAQAPARSPAGSSSGWGNTPTGRPGPARFGSLRKNSFGLGDSPNPKASGSSSHLSLNTNNSNNNSSSNNNSTNTTTSTDSNRQQPIPPKKTLQTQE